MILSKILRWKIECFFLFCLYLSYHSNCPLSLTSEKKKEKKKKRQNENDFRRIQFSFTYIIHASSPFPQKKNGRKWPLCKKKSRKPGQLLYPTLYLVPKSTFSALAKLWNPHLERYNRTI